MTHDLKTSLEDLAEAEYADAPVSTIDIGRARADGRRRMLAARLAPIGGGVALAAACAVVVTSLGGASPAKQDGGSTDASPAIGQTFAGTDPLTAIARFGYLPDGFRVMRHTTGAFYGTAVTAQTGPVPSGGAGVPTRLQLALSTFATESTSTPHETKTEVKVTGSPKAYLLSTPGDSPSIPADLRLEWQTASGSWFALGGEYQLDGDQLKALLIKVADSVSADDSAIPLPIHVEGMPKNAVLGQIEMNDPVLVGQAGFDFWMTYTEGAVSSTGSAAHGSFSISVSPVAHESHTVVIPNQEAPACKDSEDLHICVQDQPAPGGDALASVGGAKGLLDRITSLGTDPAKWTTHVVN